MTRAKIRICDWKPASYYEKLFPFSDIEASFSGEVKRDFDFLFLHTPSLDEEKNNCVMPLMREAERKKIPVYIHVDSEDLKKALEEHFRLIGLECQIEYYYRVDEAQEAIMRKVQG